MKSCLFFNQLISITLLLLVKKSIAQVVCPNPSDYFPCKCEPEVFFSNGTLIELNCRDKNLNDSRISEILDSFLSAPEVTSLVILNLGSNQLTRVPDQVRRFDRLESIYLEKNIINIVHSGAFVFPVESSNQQRIEIRLNQNEISQVEPGAFQVGRRYHIHLGKNKLNRLEAGAFQSVLEQIMAETAEDNSNSSETRIGIYDNQIDCESDPCHLAWLVRWQTPTIEGENKHRLLDFVQHAECSNGTRMEDLDPNAFIECAVHRENNFNTTIPSEPVSSVSSATNNNTSVKPVHGLPPSAVCPSKPQLYSPCECSARGDGLTSKLDCSNKGLDDQMISDILDAFILDESGRLLGHLDLKDNQLSKIPHQVKLFKQLVMVDMDQDNILTTESIVGDLSVAASNPLAQSSIDDVPQSTELMDELTSPSNSDESATELPTTSYPNLYQTSISGDDDDASKFISGVSRLFQHFQSLSSNVTSTTNVPNVTLPTFRTSLIPQDQALDNTDKALTSSVCLWFGEVLPCKCTPNYDSDGALVGLNCRNSSLTDSSMNEILDALLTKPNVTSLSHLHLSENNLTRIPDQVKLFTQLKSVDLSANQIVAIQSGAFVSHKQQMMIFLNGNQISRIEPEAFQGGNFLISLENNNLTRFDANTFKLMLERMQKNRKSSSDILLDISNNKIDCESDPCHLSWILRDDRNLIDLLSNDSVCSNNTRLKDLSQDAFISCPGGKPSNNSTVNSSTFLCPKAENVSPCLCMHNQEDDTAFLFCEERNLDDDKASKILDAFLNTPGVNPLGIVLFSANQLTRIPDQLRYFNKLSNVELNNNRISSIEPGTFVFDKIENNNTIYSLNNNQLKRLDVAVFHTLFKGMNLFDSGPHFFISIDKNPIDCKSDPCHLSWLIRENRQALNFIKDGKCSNGTRLEDLNPLGLINCPNQLRINLNLPATSTIRSPANRMINSGSFSSWIVCPKPSDYWPCVCDKIIAGVNPDTVRLSCNRKNLTDSRVSEILDAFLSTPGISPLSHIILTDNRLTRVPNQVKLFERLYVVHLQNNSIEAVQSGAFMSTRGGKDRLNVYLTDNQIRLIEPGAFQGGNYNINLKGNQLTRFDENVFQSVLERMAKSDSFYPAVVDISENPISCEGEPCHLAWLVKDNYQLLSHVKFGDCYNNKTSFDKINRSAFNNCSDS